MVIGHKAIRYEWGFGKFRILHIEILYDDDLEQIRKYSLKTWGNEHAVDCSNKNGRFVLLCDGSEYEIYSQEDWFGCAEGIYYNAQSFAPLKGCIE